MPLRLIVAIVAGALVLVTGLGSAAFYLLDDIDPQSASRDELARYLVLNDVSLRGEPFQRELVDRLETELHQGGFDGRAADLSEGMRRRLEENLAVLKKQWFEARVEDYHRSRPTGSAKLLDRSIETVVRWSELETAGDGAAGEQSTAEFFHEVDDWIEEAEGEARQQRVVAVRQGVIRWLMTRDLSQQPVAVRRELARRIVEELEYGLNLDDAIGETTPTERAQLEANALLLVEAAVWDFIDEHAAAPREQQEAIVRRQVDNFLEWGVLQYFGGEGDADMVAVLTTVNRWAETAPPERRNDLWLWFAGVSQQLRARKTNAD